MNDPTLHVVTPCIRPDNVPAMIDSLIGSLGDSRVFLRWWIIFDLPYEKMPSPSLWGYAPFVRPLRYYTAIDGVYWGGPQRSHALDLIRTGYVTFVDDDTLIHPDYFRYVLPHFHQNAGGVLYGQELKREFWDGRPNGFKWFDPRDPLCDFEHSQMTVRRDVIGSVRYEGTHDCDKRFARAVYKPDVFRILAHTLSYYNWLR